MKETEEDRIERYILTKFPDAKFTPVGKGGLKLDFGVQGSGRYGNSCYGVSSNFYGTFYLVWVPTQNIRAGLSSFMNHIFFKLFPL